MVSIDKVLLSTLTPIRAQEPSFQGTRFNLHPAARRSPVRQRIVPLPVHQPRYVEAPESWDPVPLCGRKRVNVVKGTDLQNTATT